LTRTILRYALLIATAAVLQRALFSELRVDGAVPDILLVLAVVAVSTAILVLPVARACRWADKDLERLRPALR
jgi:hypothetical protein